MSKNLRDIWQLDKHKTYKVLIFLLLLYWILSCANKNSKIKIENIKWKHSTSLCNTTLDIINNSNELFEIELVVFIFHKSNRAYNKIGNKILK